MVNDLYLIIDDMKPSDILNEKFNSESIGLRDVNILEGIAKLKIYKGDIIVIEGEISFKAVLLCSRCGEKFEKIFKEKFYREYILGKDPCTTLPQVELSRQDLDRVYIQDVGIDLAQDIREVVMTAIPIAPRCQDDCKGICPQCGQNLNIRACLCKRNEDAGWFDQFIKDKNK